MNNHYRVLYTSGLSIAFDADFALELLKRPLASDDYFNLKEASSEIASGRGLSFVEDSQLLHSAGFDSVSSCTLYMDPNQYEFLSKGERDIERLPLVLGAEEGKVVYLGYNVDGDYQRKKLMELWNNWLSFVI